MHRPRPLALAALALALSALLLCAAVHLVRLTAVCKELPSHTAASHAEGRAMALLGGQNVALVSTVPCGGGRATVCGARAWGSKALLGTQTQCARNM